MYPQLDNESHLATESPEINMVDHPPHYKAHPSGVECITVTEHMSFCVGNAVKYLWRVDEKHDDGGMADLNKAKKYIEFEIAKRLKAIQGADNEAA